jgi:hypothetical protein
MNLVPGEKKLRPPAIGTPFSAVHCDGGRFQIEQVRLWFHVWFILSGNGLGGWSKLFSTNYLLYGFYSYNPALIF